MKEKISTKGAAKRIRKKIHGLMPEKTFSIPVGEGQLVTFFPQDPFSPDSCKTELLEFQRVNGDTVLRRHTLEIPGGPPEIKYSTDVLVHFGKNNGHGDSDEVPKEIQEAMKRANEDPQGVNEIAHLIYSAREFGDKK